MELRQLKYFKAACELQNFSEAARALYISQSTLSQQIKQLEDELEVLLFDRIGKRIVPTEAGLAFLPYANKALQDAEDGKQILRDLKGIKIGNLHVGVTYSMWPVLVSALEPFTKVFKFRKYSNNVIKKAKEFDNSMIITILMSPNKRYSTL